MTDRSSSSFTKGVLLVLVSAFLFSAKAILAKLVYREIDIGVIAVLMMRMLYALPFYVISLLIALRKTNYKRFDGQPLSIARIATVVALGVIGYYISSYLDFFGLKYISAGLERIILFAYPSVVVIIETLVFKKPFTRIIALSLLFCYAGIVISYAADVQLAAGEGTLLGSLAVLLCAITFAVYVVWSGKIIATTGVSIFTPLAMLGATTAILLHAFIGGHQVVIVELSPIVHVYFLLMGVFATVVPSFLTVMGLRIIGSSNVAIVSSIGPLATIFLAWWLLAEPFGWWQLWGSLLVIAGVLLLSLKGKH